MKKSKILILILIGLINSSYSYSQNIAYANLDLVINNSNVGKKIISYFENKNQKLIKEIKDKENTIREKEKSLISQKNILQSDEYAKKVDLIKNEINEFNKYNKDKLKKLNSEKEKVSKSFLIEVNKILKEYAEVNNIDIILSSNQMLIGKSNLDLTEKILSNVNKKINNFEIK